MGPDFVESSDSQTSSVLPMHLACQEAQSAAAKMDEVWGEHLLGINAGGGDRAVALRSVLRTPPSWLVRGVELAVQALHYLLW